MRPTILFCLLPGVGGALVGCVDGTGDLGAGSKNGEQESACELISGYADSDGDGYGDRDSPQEGCEGDVASNADDCDDNDPSLTLERVSYIDGDADGWGGRTLAVSCALPPGAVARPGDCDDSNAAVHPEARERCNARDDDCDGRVDDDDVPVVDTLVWFADSDDDGHGNPDAPSEACAAPAAHVASSDDCDDSDPGRSPSAVERCLDGTDDDCDGEVDEACLQLLDTADATLRGAVSRDMLANALAVGDWDGDGHDEVAVGASNSDVGGDGSGVVYVLTGPQALRGGSVDSVGGAQLIGAPLDLAGFNFGPAVDLNADGVDDLLIGLLGGEEGLPGAVSVIYGPITTGAKLAEVEQARILGTDRYDGLGAWAIDAGTGPTVDLLVGVSGDDNRATDAGSARLFAGPVEGARSAAEAAVVFEGAVEKGALGTAALFCDLDGDGLDDAVLSEPGTAQVFVWMDMALERSGARLVTEGASNRVFDDDETSELGARVECVELNADGHLDLLIGAPAAGDPYLRSGRWDLVPGPLSPTTAVDVDAMARILDESGLSTEAGITRSGVVHGDIDDDGVADLLLGSPGHRTREVGAGGVFWFRGPLSGTVVLESADRGVLGTVVEEAAGAGLAVGDLDRDGRLDMLVGAPTDEDDYGRLGIFTAAGTAW